MLKMKNFFILAIVAVALFAGCKSPEKKEIENIGTLEKELFSEDGKLEPSRVEELIAAYVSFADTYPQDSMAANYLFKAGDVAMNTGRANQAIKFYSRILEQYPNYSKAPEALFLQGYVYENNLGRLDKAKAIYEEFLAKYPDNDFADDAEVSLKYLGKSPEELIEIFQQNANNNPTEKQE